MRQSTVRMTVGGHGIGTCVADAPESPLCVSRGLDPSVPWSRRFRLQFPAPGPPFGLRSADFVLPHGRQVTAYPHRARDVQRSGAPGRLSDVGSPGCSTREEPAQWIPTTGR